MSGTHAKDEGRLRSQSGEVCNKETSKSTSPKAVLDERGSHLSVIEPVSDALRTRTTKVSNDETGIFGGEILDGFHDSNNPTSSSLDPLMVKKLALEKLKSIRFSSRPNAGSGMLPPCSSRSETVNGEERKLKNDKRAWRGKSSKRERSLMPSCLNRHGTLRERIEEVVALSITQVADLSDIELRSLIAYMLKLHRQQEQIYQGKRAKIEALREMLRQIEEDVAQLNKFLLFHTRSSCAPPAALHNFRGERPMVASETTDGTHSCAGAQPQPPIAYDVINGCLMQTQQKPAPRLSQPFVSTASSHPRPAAPPWLNSAEFCAMVVPAPSDSVPVLQRPADTSRIEKTNVSTGPPSALRSDVPSTPLTAVSNVSLIGEHSDFPAVFMRPSFTTRPTGIFMPPPAFPFLPPPGGPNELPPFSVLPPMPNAITLPPPGFGQKPISHSRLTNIMAAPSPEAAARPQPLPNKPIASLGCLLDMSCPPPYIRQPASLPISRPIDRPMLGDKPLFEVANEPTASSHIPAGSFPPVVPTGCPLPQTSLPPLGPGHLMSIPPPSASGPASVSTASKFSLANVSIGFASRIVDASKFISRPGGLDDSGQFRYSNQGLQKVHRQPNE